MDSGENLEPAVTPPAAKVTQPSDQVDLTSSSDSQDFSDSDDDDDDSDEENGGKRSRVSNVGSSKKQKLLLPLGFLDPLPPPDQDEVILLALPQPVRNQIGVKSSNKQFGKAGEFDGCIVGDSSSFCTGTTDNVRNMAAHNMLIPPHPPIGGLPPGRGNSSTRPLVIERKVEFSGSTDYGCVSMLERVGWLPILSFHGQVYPSVVYEFLHSIVSWSREPLSITIRVNGNKHQITPTDISQITGLPCAESIDVFTAEKSKEKVQWTRVLCGKKVEWKKSSLRAALMLPEFRVLHSIFTTNVYPRAGNVKELTLNMAKLLYLVGTGRKLCLPSYILYHIGIFFSQSRSNVAIPFSYLLTRLGISNGINPTPHDVPRSAPILSIDGIKNFQSAGSTVSNDSSKEDEPHQQRQAPETLKCTSVSSRSIEDRLDSLEASLAKSNQTLEKIMSYLTSIGRNCQCHDMFPPSSG